MKERPIVFSAPMVRAILEGRKTQTRLPVVPELNHVSEIEHVDSDVWRFALKNSGIKGQRPWHLQRAPCQVGGRLWVRETWQAIRPGSNEPLPGPMKKHPGGIVCVCLAATNEERCRYPGPWRPASRMPRWASRITLDVTGMRVERLQDISEADACAEGLGSPFTRDCKVPKFAALWDRAHGSGSWDANPMVWVVEFRQIGENHALDYT